jgi:DNA-directed RNA polymerase sigma subunit (sigma70/sigma32)
MADVDLDLWNSWNSRGRRVKDMQPLFNQFAGAIEKQVGQYAGRVNIPPSAIRANAQQNFVDAIRTFDPNKGVKLNTHVTWNLQKTKRFIAQNQNFARLPEPMIYRIGDYERAEDRLRHRVGRDPTIVEMADELKWPPAHVERMRKSLRRDLSANLFELDPSSLQVSRWSEVKSMIPYELTPQENAVFELLYKRRQLSNNDIANRLNLSPSRVSKIKLNIANKVGRYM